MKRALVTGSSRGIGREKAEALAAELGSEAIRCDVADSAQVNAMFERTGGVDLLVSNAGIAWSGLLSDMTDEEWRRIVDVNLGGAFNCCRAAIPHMVREKAGAIVCVSSILGVYGGSCETAYSATKGALISFVKGLAKELGPSGIRVNAVAPGVINTDMNADLSPEELQALADKTPLGTIGSPYDIARAVLYLSSPDAKFITGHILAVNGGFVV